MGLKKMDVTNYDVQDKRVATWRCNFSVALRSRVPKAWDFLEFVGALTCFRAPSELTLAITCKFAILVLCFAVE